MPQTRASARLAKSAKAEPPDEKSPLELSSKVESRVLNANQTEAQNLEYAQEEKEYDRFKNEPLFPPKRTRGKTNRLTKTSADSCQPPVPVKRVRHVDFMNLPVDLFTEIALHLMPRDIISLSRLNKSFRLFLMRRSARHIWCCAMRNVPDLPPCPADISEPHYLAMIYIQNCMMCGMATNRRMDEVLCTRLCIPCAKEAMVSMPDFLGEVARLVLCSTTILQVRDYQYKHWAFRSHVESVQTKLKELEDPQARQTWKEEKQRSLKEQQQQVDVLRKFTCRIGWERRKEVETRLLKESWDQADLDFRDELKQEWIGLVEHPEPLTGHIWETLKPQLIPLLEANRVENIQRERERMEENRDDLEDRMGDLDCKTKPIVKATIYRPATTSGSPLSPPTEYLRYTGIFPDIVDVLEWDETKEVLEVDLAYNDYPIECVWDVMAPFNGCVSEWIADIEAVLVEILRKGRVDDGLSSDFPSPSLPLADQSGNSEDSEDSDDEELPDGPFKYASENQKVLVRADSLFRSIRNGAPVTYEGLVETAYATATRKTVLNYTQSYKTAPLDTSKFWRHAAGQAQARKILEWMGKPDATFLEMKSVGSAYTCGRCPDGYAHSWEGIVDHFVFQAQNWKRIENKRVELAMHGIVFHNVHDPAWETDKPLVRILSEAEKTQMRKAGKKMEECWLCSQVEPEITTLGLQHKIREHLQDMHAIPKPKYRVHYGPWKN